MIAPHGGELIDRLAPEEDREGLLREADRLAKVTLGPRALSDLEMISTGVFSPLTGFMVQTDYDSVVETMHLKNGLVWSLPITLSVNDAEAGSVSEGDEVALVNGDGRVLAHMAGAAAAASAAHAVAVGAGDGRVLATMTVEDKYVYDKEREAREVFGTTNEEHPGVAAVYRPGEVGRGAGG